MLAAMTLIIRPLQPADAAEWRRLWTAYLDFYETKLPEAVYASTWARLFAEGAYEPRGWIALVDGRAAGIVHALMHRTCWSERDNCYLQDLFADPEVRGTGVGRALIEEVYRHADRLGANQVYWMTQDGNATARLLYDRIAKNSGFIKYVR